MLLQMKEISREIEKRPEVNPHDMTEQEQLVVAKELRELEQRQQQILIELGMVLDLRKVPE